MSADELELWMIERIAESKHAAPDTIDPGAPFTDHGLDSMAALQLTADLQAKVGRPCDATLLWEYPTITALAHHLGS